MELYKAQDLENKVIVVTGASSGIGEATALMLAPSGCKLVLVARRVDRLEVLAQKTRALGAQTLVVGIDIAEKEEVKSGFKKIYNTFGQVDVLVNNAGLMPISYLDKLKIEEWDRMIDVNLKGLLYCIAGVLPEMKARKSGHIINISSTAGRRPMRGFSVYNATKFAVVGLSEAMRLELTADFHIKITLILPGAAATELVNTITDEDILREFASGSDLIPMKSEEVARSIVFAINQPDEVNIGEILVMPRSERG